MPAFQIFSIRSNFFDNSVKIHLGEWVNADIEINLMQNSDKGPHMPPDKRIDAMEEMLAHHEKVIEELSGQLAGQWKTITDMENRMSVLTRRFASLEENALAAPEITKPPHY